MRRFTLASVLVLVVFLTVTTIAAVLLAETVNTAQEINDKAANIAVNGRGINSSTDSIIQLHRTNALAVSILHSAAPLQRQLATVVSLAGGIDNEAGSIDSSAGTINSSAVRINSTAHSINTDAGSINASAGSVKTSALSINSSAGLINNSAGSVEGSALKIGGSASGINGNATSILTYARRINTDVNLINDNLDVTISLAGAIKGDTGNIVQEAATARSNAACIDSKVEGSQGSDGQCLGNIPEITGKTESLQALLATKGATRLGQLAVTPASTPAPTSRRSPAVSQGGTASSGTPAQSQSGASTPAAPPATSTTTAAPAPTAPATPLQVVQQIIKHLIG